jgi:4-aminobutyrate aminotransferase-like enzyme
MAQIKSRQYTDRHEVLALEFGIHGQEHATTTTTSSHQIKIRDIRDAHAHDQNRAAESNPTDWMSSSEPIANGAIQRDHPLTNGQWSSTPPDCPHAAAPCFQRGAALAR